MDENRLSSALRRFKEIYGDGEAQAMRAPARINILGDHVDYVSYMPTASLAFGSREHDMLMIFRATDDGQVRGASTLEKFPPFSFALDEVEIEDHTKQSWESFVFDHPAPAPHWSNYVKGAVSFARWKYGAGVKHGFDFLIESSIPPNGGASSSSALVTLAGAAIRMVNRIEYDLAELARDSSEAEWFVGTRGGALDHMTICLARRGRLLHISHRDRRADPIPLPVDGFRWVAFFSHEADKGREAMLEYNERAAVSRLLIPALEARAKEDPDFQTPETITLDEIARLDPQTFQECARAFPALVDERRAHALKIERRQRHHIAEMVFVGAAVVTLTELPPFADARMRTLGQLMNRSHASLRDQYEVSTPEVEALIAVLSADPHVYGARLMGGGFGGNVLALTRGENTQALIDRAQNGFYGPRGRDASREGAVMVSTPGDGLEALNL